MTTTNVTTSQANAGLIEDTGTKWTGTITYSVPGSGAVWEAGYSDGEPFDADYGTLNTTQAANFERAVELWDSYIATEMSKVADSTPGDIRVAFTDVTARQGSGVAAYAYYPPSGSEIAVHGDVWIDETYKSSSFADRSADFEILIHELGHALGLKHSFESPTVPAGYDSTTYTVMSYTTDDVFYTWSGGGGSVSYSARATTSFTPMVLDIVAIQTLYGKDTATGAGTTVYAFEDDDLNGRQTIYDASGTDTIDLSAVTRGSNIDLRPGAYSDIAFYSVEDQIRDLSEEYGSGFESFFRSALTNSSQPAYQWSRNVAIAFSTTIENAIGSSKADNIIGNSSANRLDGGGGADTLEGEGGNDTYIVDSNSDVIVELSTEGTSDTVRAKVTYDLLENIFVETLMADNAASTASLNLYGNKLKQEIVGNAGKNILSDGGAGASDVLTGLRGNDTYRVYNSGDVIIEREGQGTDTVQTNVTFDLLEGVFVENLMALDPASTKAINLYGNTRKQVITGNAGANIISDGGKALTDKLVGLGGNDTYRVYNSGDIIVERSGEGTNDKVEANVDYTLGAGVHIETLKARDAASTPALRLSGNEFGQTIIGTNGGDVLSGFGGADKIFGGKGNDTLSGGTGADDYVFDTALNETTNVDKIVGFSSIDEILLSKAIFTALGAVGTLASAAFASNTSGNAGDTSDRIIYETDTGELYYDANGSTSGGSVLFATLDKNLSLAHSDFIIVA